MRTFYDFRTPDYKNPEKHSMQGRVILKWKNYWLLKIYKDPTLLGSRTPFNGYIVCPQTIYLYDVYIAESFWDALRYLFFKPNKINKTNLKIFNELEDKCEADEINKWACKFSHQERKN